MGWEVSWTTSGLGAHLTWTLPFGFLIMIAVFNRFDKSYEEAARDLGSFQLADNPPCCPTDHWTQFDWGSSVRVHSILR